MMFHGMSIATEEQSIVRDHYDGKHVDVRLPDDCPACIRVDDHDYTTCGDCIVKNGPVRTGRIAGTAIVDYRARRTELIDALREVSQYAAQEIGVPYDECTSGPIGKARKLLLRV